MPSEDRPCLHSEDTAPQPGSALGARRPGQNRHSATAGPAEFGAYTNAPCAGASNDNHPRTRSPATNVPDPRRGSRRPVASNRAPPASRT